MKKILLILFGASILCFCGSLYFHAFYTDNNHHDPAGGIALFLMGWLALFTEPVKAISWLANPLYIAALIGAAKKKDNKIVFILSLLSFILSTFFLSVESMTLNPGGGPSIITSYGLGYWLWIAAPFILMIGQYIDIKLSQKTNKHHR